MDINGSRLCLQCKNSVWHLIVLLSLLLAAASTVWAQTAEPLEFRINIERHANGTLQAAVRVHEWDQSSVGYPFQSPFTIKQLRDLRWYVEQYWRWPLGPDAKRGQALEEQFERWGRTLFQAVLKHPEALRIWQDFRGAEGRPRLLTIDTTEPDALRLPWELLADEEGHLFALDISIRRRIHKIGRSRSVPFELPVRILMVVARPSELSFIDPRASSKALLQALDELGTGQVAVEFLETPTLADLDRRLRDDSRPRVHVVHFDGHGVYRTEEGLGYLAFEDAEGGLDLVDADRLGNLLVSAKSPLLVLDACQSAYADAPDPYSSIAPRLIKAGIGSVVAMQYSVLVPTSRQFFSEFYRALAQGRSIGQAMDEGRRGLLANTNRFTMYHPDHKELQFRMKDWFLPVLYQRQRDPVPFDRDKIQPSGGREIKRLYGDFPVPKYRFIGRARELWTLQRDLQSHGIVVVHGLAGQGKTALATEASRWLTRTGRFKRAVFVSFEQGGDAQSAISEMGRALGGDAFYRVSEPKRLAELQKRLAASSTLVVWDNFESVLPGWKATLPEGALRELLELGVTFSRQGSTRLLITTRDRALPHPAYAPSRQTAYLDLKGMRPSEALELAGEVLDARKLPRPERPELQQLLDYLGGHPLSIILTLQHLHRYDNDVSRVIDRFEALYPGFRDGSVKNRNQSLEASLRFSLDRLSDTAREHLEMLGVFRGGAMSYMVPLVAGWKAEEWSRIRDVLITDLEQAGLLRIKNVAASRGALQFLSGDKYPPQAAFQESLTVPYYRFHPTLAPYLRRQQKPEIRRALEKRYRELYYVIAGRLYYLDDRAPQTARAIVQRDLPNLHRALDLTLEAEEYETAIGFADRIERFLDYFGRWRQRDALLNKIRIAVDSLADDGPLTKAQFLAASRRGEVLRQEGRAAEAEKVFQTLLARMDAGIAYEGEYDRALTLGRLGLSLRDQGRPREAEIQHRQALDMLQQLDRDNRSVLREISIVHTELADVLSEQGRFEEAREEYEKGLKIKEELGDLRNVIVSKAQLGTLAMRQGDLVEARRRYREALEIARQLKEPLMEAVAWHQLGIVAENEAEQTTGQQREERLSESEVAYKESLRLKETHGDQSGAARSANQLANIAVIAGRLTHAEHWYRRALGHFEGSNQQRSVATVANNLAVLLLQSWRIPADQRPNAFAATRELLAEAQQWALRAASLREAIGDPSLELWSTYSILAQIAEAQDDTTAIHKWRRKERVAYVAFPGHWSRDRVERWSPIIAAIAAHAQSDATVTAEAKRYLNLLSESTSWRNLAAALRQVIAGRRDGDTLADEHGLDREDYLILTKVLEKLSPAPTNP